MRKKMMMALLILIILIMLFPASCFAATLDNGLTVDTSGWQSSELEHPDAHLIYHGDLEDLELGIFTKRDLTSNRTHSWGALSEEELEALAAAVMDTQKDDSASVEDWSTFYSPQMRFLKFTGKVSNEEGKQKNFVQYFTIENGGTLQFSFYKDTAFSAQDLSVMDDFVGSAHFEESSEPSIDTVIVLKLAGILFLIILLAASVIWNIRRYRRKIQVKN